LCMLRCLLLVKVQFKTMDWFVFQKMTISVCFYFSSKESFIESKSIWFDKFCSFCSAVRFPLSFFLVGLLLLVCVLLLSNHTHQDTT
jgi:hypothetical protein